MIDMKIKIKNLGILRQAEFELGDLTIICGNNNSGKTYATYALFGFLDSWKSIIEANIAEEIIQQLLDTGSVEIDLLRYQNESRNILNECCRKYSRKLPEVFAANEERFKDTDFQIILGGNQNILSSNYENRIGTIGSKTKIFSLIKEKDSSRLQITLLSEKNNINFPQSIIRKIISDAIIDIIFSPMFPRVFIASAERTGAAIFRKELNFAKNRLLEELNKAEGEIDRFELLFQEGYEDYALPVRKNVEFTRTLESFAKRNSQLASESNEILESFSDIIGGKYTVTKDDELYFIPNNNKRTKLTMDESSSSVRSLLDIIFYLKHKAQKGDLLIIDEPELNLHPENQRSLARLIAQIVNFGIKVFITTHSDYIVKELNTLIMLNNDEPHLKIIAEKEGYKSNELMNINQIRAYVSGEERIQVDGLKHKKCCQTLIPADIDQKLGIEIQSFDTAIETMNRIQEAILWGGAE